MPAPRLIALLATLAGLVVPAAAQAVSPTTTRIVNASGQQLNGDTRSSDISADGRWVAFATTATNAVATPTGGVREVYLSDRATGAVVLVSKAGDGTAANGSATQPTISADGRFVAFQTSATNLAGGATNTTDDVYLYDRTTDSVRRLSTSVTGGDADSWARDARVSADGSTVVFTSPADNLVAGDTGQIDVFAVPTAGGPIQRVSAAPGGGTADGTSVNGDASNGGRFVVFATDATDIVAGDMNGKRDIVILDRATGTRTRASVTSSGGEANADSNYPSITANGCVIVFDSSATNLTGADDGSGATKAFVRDRCQGATEIASLRNDGTQGSVNLVPPAISDDGCIVAAISPDMTPGAPASGAVALRDRCQGQTSRADVSSAGDPSNGALYDWPHLSAGAGRYVTFGSTATGLVPGDSNAVSDTFVHDRATTQAPVADLQITTSAGRSVVADASGSTDADGRITASQISWGDGSPADAGPVADHAYTRSGAYTVTLVVTDSDGLVATTSRAVTIPDAIDGSAGPAPGTPSPVPGSTRLRLTLKSLTLSRTTFSARPAHGKAPKTSGATLKLTVSAAATLHLRFERLVAGRLHGHSCVAGAKHGTRCTARRAAGATSASLHAGRNTLSLTGRVGGHALPAGRYRLTITARAADGRASGSQTRTLTIKKGTS